MLNPVSPSSAAPRTPAAMLRPAALLGAGLGGMLDGIVLHQVLQWHGMLSARVPPATMEAMRFNMFWDGVFHAAMWLVVVLAVVLLLRAAARPEAAWRGRALIGAALFGWGLFNVIEGLIDHQWLALHHVMDQLADPWPADLAFLVFGCALLALGALLVASAGPAVIGRRVDALARDAGGDRRGS